MAEIAAEEHLPRGAIQTNLRKSRLILLLGYVQIVLLAVAISGAGWAPTGAWLILSILMALILGTLLSISRFNGFTAIIYTIVISLAGVSVVITPLVPAFRLIPTLGYIKYIELLNWRVLAFITQVPGWIQSLVTPSSSLPVKGAQFLLAFAAWNLVVWLLWWAFRCRQALIGLLPAGLLAALAIYRQSGELNVLAAFFFCGLLLIAASAHRRKLDEWEQKHISYPYGSIEWPLSILVIAAAVTLAARFIPIVASPQGRRSLVELFQPPPQATPIAAAASKPGSISQPSTPEITLWAGIDSMQEISTPPTSLNSTILWLQIYNPTDPQEAHYYLRGQVFASYTGRGWMPPDQEPYPSASPPILSSARQEPVQQRIEILANHDETLFAINRPVLAGDGTSLVFTQPDSSILLHGSLNRYEVTSSVIHPDASHLEDSGTQYPPDLMETYLQLPANLPSRIGELTERITAGAQTPFEMAMRLQDFLRTSYPYSLDTPPAPQGKDIVDYFLFDAQGGFCSYYASAMAVMLRLEGVPARIATGFIASEYLREQGVFRVPASAAHAWVEVYFPGYGWIEFEPTSSQPPLMYTGEEKSVDSTVVSSSPGAVGQWLDRAVGSLLSNLSLQIAFLCILASAAGFVLLQVMQFLKPWWLTSSEPTGLYWQMRHSMEKVGFTSNTSTTPQEFLHAADKILPRQSLRLQESIQLTTHNYVMLTFSPHPPGQSSLVEAQQTWRRAFFDWLMLWLKVTLSRFGRSVKSHLASLRRRRRQDDSNQSQAGEFR